MRVKSKSLSSPTAGQSAVRPKAMPSDPDLMTFRDVVAAMRAQGVPLCGYTIRKRIAAGELKAVKTSYRLLIPRVTLEKYIARLKLHK